MSEVVVVIMRRIRERGEMLKQAQTDYGWDDVSLPSDSDVEKEFLREVADG